MRFLVSWKILRESGQAVVTADNSFCMIVWRKALRRFACEGLRSASSHGESLRPPHVFFSTRNLHLSLRAEREWGSRGLPRRRDPDQASMGKRSRIISTGSLPYRILPVICVTAGAASK